ncbi:hypothetical protein [uncultured Streptomyces sp.]|uniref:hypothetical protein n=1 Tax=uncultured Streptomyces sp. TaxID=174707 RepID=UPI0026291D7B|nr:hypothetical protein [uncultured Streptomyces sp.]
MQGKQVALLAATATIMGWSVVMATLGREDAVAALAPALAVVAQQIAPPSRSHTEPSSGHRVAAVPDKEDCAP